MKSGREHRRAMEPSGAGIYRLKIQGACEGDRYGFFLDGQGPYPDPASRFQPEGVHGLSEVVDAGSFQWTDSAWPGISLDRLTVYELHIGTFSKTGDFAGAARHLPELKDLGVGAIEIMPVADFSGSRNWGYDGASLFAPARCYGRPEDLRRLVDASHAAGLGVLLDVVYNHLGPDGAYLGRFSPSFFSNDQYTPWGPAVNLDGEGCEMARRFLIENAVHWIREYHMDGLRLDATHALIDRSGRHFLDELREAVHQGQGARRSPLVIAEDDRNEPALVRPPEEQGYGLDAVWADDLHHQFRVLLRGDRDGYFQDFSSSAADIARTLETGWWYTRQLSALRGSPRGSDPKGVPLSRFVVCLQNHDQVGNRAFGDRIHHGMDLASFRAASALLLCAPETPLLFMGQEWAASTPFQYFTDHAGVLGDQVRSGRRKEFARFSAFTDPEVRGQIPDPQCEATFERSRLRRDECDQEPHASMRRFYQALLKLRGAESVFAQAGSVSCSARGIGEDGIIMIVRSPHARGAVCVIAKLKEQGVVLADADWLGKRKGWQVLISSEDPRFAADPVEVTIENTPRGIEAHFLRPGALILEGHG